MSYSVHAYLTDAKKVKSVYGSKDRNLLDLLSRSLSNELAEIDNSFPEVVNGKRGSHAVLRDIVNGIVSFPETPFLYGYVYEKICEYYGQPIYNNENMWELDEQSVFIPIPLSEDFPYIISLDSNSLLHKKEQYLSIEEGQGIGDYDYGEERDDLTFIFDTAIAKNMDLLLCVY